MSENIKRNWQRELRFLLPLCFIAFLVFANSLGGEFVHDDLRQIARNPLIQDSGLYVDALTSDVWAFKGDGTITASNYWRPTFTAYHIFNFALFGLDPVGWHLLNLLLHTGVCLVAFLLLRRWGVSDILSFAISLIFAVNPVHTESVAWISGAPDLLFALFFLGSLWFADRFAADGKKLSNLIVSGILYALALGSKEVAMVSFPIYFLIFKYRQPKLGTGSKPAFWDSDKYLTGLFVLIAIGYFFLRWRVLGMISQPGVGAVGFADSFLSIPAVFVFYLKQLIFPMTLGTNYPLRPVLEFNFFQVVLPLIISVSVLFGFWKLFKRSFILKIGIALMILPLAPTLNISAYVPEEIVHDRYLYLPLLGFLIIVFSLLDSFIANRFAKGKLIILTAAVIISGALAVKTISYNAVWTSSMSLWQHNLEIDPDSSTNNSQYGGLLFEQKKYAESFEFFDRSIQIKPSAIAYLGRGRALVFLQQNEKAVEDLTGVLKMPIDAYTLYQTYESLAIVYVNQKKFEEATAALLEARQRLPIYRAALTEKLAIVYYQQGKKEIALRELEGAQAQARIELLPESKNVFLRLGMLYAELGRRDEARKSLQEYLQLTAPIKETSTLDGRKQAADLLKKLQ